MIFLFLPPGSIFVARLSEKQVIDLLWPYGCRTVKKIAHQVPEQLYTSGESSVFRLFVGGLSRREGNTNPYNIKSAVL